MCRYNQWDSICTKSIYKGIKECITIIENKWTQWIPTWTFFDEKLLYDSFLFLLYRRGKIKKYLLFKEFFYFSLNISIGRFWFSHFLTVNEWIYNKIQKSWKLYKIL